MQKIIFATGNKNKLKEAAEILGGKYELVTAAEAGITEDIPETSDTIEGNASQKSHYLWKKTSMACFADDTGLDVEALGGRPGVYSARYAGDAKDSKANMEKLLSELEGEKNRNARFRTVISLITGGKEYLFEGILKGRITESQRGNAGFGYDPVFMPEGYDKTLAEMPLHEKNLISHRGIAVRKLAEFLNRD